MSKFVQIPASGVSRPAIPVDNGATFATASDAMLEVAKLEKQSQAMKAEYQHLRARIEKLSQADVNASISAPSSFSWFAAVIASLGLAATMGVAAVKKYTGQGQQGSESATAFQVPLVARAPQRAGPIVAMAQDAGDLDLEGLKALAFQQNPVVGYFDPLSLSEAEFFEQTNTATIGFLRQAEL